MAEILVGDVVARLRADLSQFVQALADAQQRLQQFAQVVSQIRQVQASAQQSTTHLTQAVQSQSQVVSEHTKAHTGYTHVLGQTRQSLQEFVATQRAMIPQFQVMTAGLTQGATSQQAYQRSVEATRTALTALSSGVATARAQSQHNAQQVTQQTTAQQTYQTTLRQTQQAQDQVRVSTERLSTAQQQASQTTRTQASTTQQAAQQLSALPYNAITNAASTFDRTLQQAGNSQARYRQALTQGQEALRQFGVTTLASGAMVDRFGQRLSQGSAQALRDFQVGIREAQAELRQFERFGINASAASTGGGLLQRVLGVAGGIGIATTLAAIVSQVKQVVTESVTLSARMQDLALSFQAIEGSAEAARTRMGSLFETAQRLGVDFVTAAEGFRRFSAAARGTALEGQAVGRAFEGMLIGARAMGSTSEQSQRALAALEQALSKGRLQAEELRGQLAEAIPGALRLMAEGLGVSTRALESMVQTGLLPPAAAIIAMTERMRQLGEVGGPNGPVARISSVFAQLKNETTAWLTALGDGINTVLMPFLQELISISEELRRVFGIRPPGQQGPQAATAIPPATPQDIAKLITQEAGPRNLDPGLLARLFKVESNFDPEARSPKGALGLGQLMPATARELQPGITEQQIREPATNVRLAAEYLSRLMESFKKDTDQVALALAAYNAGIGTVTDIINAEAKRLTAEARRADEARRAAGGPALTAAQERAQGEAIRRQAASYATIAPQLPTETQNYVRKIMEMAGGQGLPTAGLGQAVPGATTAPGVPLATGGGTVTDPRAMDALLKGVREALDTIPELRKQFDNLRTSELNFGGVLTETFKKQADEAVDKFQGVVSLLAQMPDLAKQMTEEQRAQVSTAVRLVASLQAQVLAETQSGTEAEKRVAQLREMQRLEEQLAAEGPAKRAAAAAELTRVQAYIGAEAPDTPLRMEQTARVEGEKAKAALLRLLGELRQDPAWDVGGELRASFERALTQIDASIEQHAQQAGDAVRERLKSVAGDIQNILGRTETFIEGAGGGSAERARLRVEQQGEELTAGLLAAQQRLTQNAGFQQAFPALARQLAAALEEALATLPAAIDRTAGAAAEAHVLRIRGEMGKLGDDVEMIQTKLGVAVTDPMSRALAKIRQEYLDLDAKINATMSSLTSLRPQASEEQQAAIDDMLAKIKEARLHLEASEQAAIRARQTAGGTALLADMQTQLDRMRARGTGGDILRLPEMRAQMREDFAKAEPEGISGAQALRIRQYEEEILAQEQLNYVMEISGRIGQSMSQVITSGLINMITTTQSAGEAFEAMGKQILETIAQITLNEGFRLLIGFGLQALAGALAPSVPYSLAPAGAGPSNVFMSPGFAGAPGVPFQHGGAVDRETYAVLGENAATVPEVVLNRQQLAAVFDPRQTRPIGDLLLPAQVAAIQQVVPQATLRQARPTLPPLLGRPEATLPRTMLRAQAPSAVLAPQMLPQLQALTRTIQDAMPARRMPQLPTPPSALTRPAADLPRTMERAQAPSLPLAPQMAPQLRSLTRAIQDAIPALHAPALPDLPRSLPRLLAFAEGGVIRQPTMAMLGESAATRPEYVLNRPQMDSLMQTAMRATPAAGGQSARGQSQDISVIVVDSREKAQLTAERERSLGRTVIIQSVLDELSQGSGSRIGRAVRMTQ